MMRLTTWNVNGIRNPFSYPPWNTARTFSAMFDILASDIVVMQELKIQRKDLRDDMVLIDGWDCYFSLPKHKKGYSGVGIYTRNDTCAPIRAEEGILGVLPSPSGTSYCELPEESSIGGYPNAMQLADLGVDPVLLDSEGRCVIVEFPAFVLLGVYSPANSNGLRDDFRYGFICALDCRIRNLIRLGKRVILVGDLNVSRDEKDGAGVLEEMRKNGISHNEYISTPNRRIFNQLIIGGEVFGERDEGRESGVLYDSSREFHPERIGMYTHWETKINARPGNFGSRIDFVLVSEPMFAWLKTGDIQEGLLGSDHCPVFVDFNETVQVGEREVHLPDIMNPPGTFESGVRQIPWKVSTVPSFSAKRLPEFDKRRSIKSMFAAPTLKKSQSKPSVDGMEEQVLRTPSPVKRAQLQSPVDGGNEVPSVSQPSPLKRSGSTLSKPKSTKRTRSDQDASSAKGQKSLKGFFQAKPKTDHAESNAITRDTPSGPLQDGDALKSPKNTEQGGNDQSKDPRSVSDFAQENAATLQADGESSPPNDRPPPSSQDSTISSEQFASKLAAAEQIQKSWGVLFSRPVAPSCEGHQEPCKTMLTKKKGSNQGRSFWMCNRPLGPSGNKERGTEWRCPTFIWCSDWSNRGEGE